MRRRYDRENRGRISDAARALRSLSWPSPTRDTADRANDRQLKFHDVWGTEQTYNHMSAGWAWALDTPFDWFEQNASRLGGINQNMAVSWPARIKDRDGLREQFVHVIAVVPTILEASGIRAPEIVDGIKQKPIEGVSFL